MAYTVWRKNMVVILFNDELYKVSQSCKRLRFRFGRLAFVADFGTRIFNLKTNLIWKTEIQLTTKTAMTLTAC
jgi:hypothetical protein